MPDKVTLRDVWEQIQILKLGLVSERINQRTWRTLHSYAIGGVWAVTLIILGMI